MKDKVVRRKFAFKEGRNNWKLKISLCRSRSIFGVVICKGPAPVAERSKERVGGQLLAGIAGSNSARGVEVCLLDCCVLSGREVCANGQTLVQKGPTACGVSLCVI